MTQEETDKLFDKITSNGCREMEKTRFHQAINETIEEYRSVLNDIKRLYVIEGDSKSMIKEVAKILSGATDLLIK